MALDGLVYCKGARSERTAQLESRRRVGGGGKTPAAAARHRPTKRVNEGVLERTRRLQEAMSGADFVKCRDEAPERGDPRYGRPQEGTQTAERGRRAHSHVHKEMLELCEVIYMNGVEDEDDHTAAILFGDLFRMYTRISDKVVGLLLRARKYGLVHFEPEMLFQGQDDDEPVFLVKPMQQIYLEYNASKGFTAAKNGHQF